jgi:hypothetical protein
MPSVLLVEVEHSDAAAFGGQTSADRLADPGAAAGDERDLTRVPTRDNVCIRHRGSPLPSQVSIWIKAREQTPRGLASRYALPPLRATLTPKSQGRFWYWPADRRERARTASG